MILDEVRPSADNVAGDWTAVGESTLWEATSDDSDSSYAQNAVMAPGLAFSMTVAASHTPTAGHERHRVRVRSRHAFGTVGMGATMGVRAFYPVDISQILTGPSATIADYAASWSFVSAAQATGPINIQWQAWLPAVMSGAANARIYELYFDVDTREPPDFTPEVRDGAGVDQVGGTITDTSIPTYVFGTVDPDGLTPRSWSLSVVDDATSAVVFTASGIGAAPSTIPGSPLANGNYTATFTAVSTIRADDPYSGVEVASFEVDFDPPAPPVLSATPFMCDGSATDAPVISVCWEPEPGSPGTEWDDPDELVIELWRNDCNGDVRLYVAQEPDGCFCDCTFGLDREPECAEPVPCVVEYRARYWGLVDGVLVATDWVEV